MARKNYPAEPLETIGLAELCALCGVPAEVVIELVDDGIVEPAGGGRGGWVFSAVALRRVRVVRRLQRDLGVNRAGAGLVLDLLEEMHSLRSRVRVLEAQQGE
ncbi:MAG: chaperone modulator CbpM [Salinisphaera sp.]|nr:chaperone modulator CbpM [Salinisphaera sp.]